MGIKTVESALDRLANKFGYTCVHDEPSDEGHVAVYELKSSRYADYRGFLKAEVTGSHSSEEVYLTWSMPLAVVEDLRAAPALLLQNHGGLKDSSFYFALSKRGDEFFLIAEAKANDRFVSEDVIFWRVFNWFDDAPFLTTWNIPDGLSPFIPAIRNRNKAISEILKRGSHAKL